jgi:hypothetical protein
VPNDDDDDDDDDVLKDFFKIHFSNSAINVSLASITYE